MVGELLAELAKPHMQVIYAAVLILLFLHLSARIIDKRG